MSQDYLVIVDEVHPDIERLTEKLLKSQEFTSYKTVCLSVFCKEPSLDLPIIVFGKTYAAALLNTFPDLNLLALPHQNRLVNTPGNRETRKEAIGVLQGHKSRGYLDDKIIVSLSSSNPDVIVSDEPRKKSDRPCLTAHEVLVLDAFKRVFPDSVITVMKGNK